MVRSGFVLVTPEGLPLAESFRPTREACKGWLASRPFGVGGHYLTWKAYARLGWRIKPADLCVAL